MNLIYKMCSVLVTGGAGFIGSHLVEKLVESGAQVTVLDNLSTGKKENLEKVKEHITFIEGDITDIKICTAAAQNKDVIFHLGAFVSVPNSITNPYVCFEDNIIGTHNILHAACINKVKRVVFSSSAAVYGSKDTLCSETDNPQPESPYGHSKLVGEQLCTLFSKSFGVETAMLRYFNVYGPRSNPNGPYAAVIAKFKDLMAANKPITIFGDGLQTRDFVPVAKVAEANMLLGLAPKELVDGRVFNIASGKSITLLELVEWLKKDFPNYTGEIIFKPERPGDLRHSQADCSAYQEVVRASEKQAIQPDNKAGNDAVQHHTP